MIKTIQIVIGCVFPVIGAVCMLFPEYVTASLPYLLGGAMAVDGLAQIAIYARKRGFLTWTSTQLARGLILLIMGSVFYPSGQQVSGTDGNDLGDHRYPQSVEISG